MVVMRLQCMYVPADEVSDDVGVADYDLSAVLFLRRSCAVEVLAESSLNPRTVTEKLLK